MGKMMIGSLWIHSNAILNAIGPARLTHPDCSKRGTSLTPPMKDYSNDEDLTPPCLASPAPLKEGPWFPARSTDQHIASEALERSWSRVVFNAVAPGWLRKSEKQWRWVSDKQRYKTMLRWRVRNRWTEEFRTSGSFGKAQWWSHGSGQVMIIFGGITPLDVVNYSTPFELV